MMGPRKVLILLAFFIASIGSAAEYVPGQVIVKFKTGADRGRITMSSIYTAAGVKHVYRFGGIMKGFEQLFLEDNVKVEDAIAELQKSPSVEFAQPNYILHALPTADMPQPQPTDPPGNQKPPCLIPGIEFPPGCDPNGSGGGGGLPNIPGLPGGGGGLPNIPGLPGGGNGGGDCLIPGIPFPPGCHDGGGTNPNPIPTPEPTTPPPAERPALQDPPAEVTPPVADPDLDKAYGIAKIGAVDAWNITKGSKDFVVAVIDTGIDYNHEDLSFNVWRNPNPTDKDIVGYDFIHNDGLPYDDQGHGTHTAGTIGAVGGNGKGVSGVMQRVSIMAVKFLSAEGSGDTAGAIKSIDYAITHGARVLSNSWGGSGDDDNKGLYAAIERAKDKGVLFVAAAGNDGVDNDSDPRKSFPAAFDNDNLISVAATDRSDELAFFSNFGAKTVHVAAPGTDVYSLKPGNQYVSESGTSMACPHVAGAAALLWSAHPTWTYKQVKDTLIKSADPIASLQGKMVSGGRVNVNKALQQAAGLQ